jgi:hypothetical protein
MDHSFSPVITSDHDFLQNNWLKRLKEVAENKITIFEVKVNDMLFPDKASTWENQNGALSLFQKAL